jgi:lipopolysaccharide transport system permease protein
MVKTSLFTFERDASHPQRQKRASEDLVLGFKRWRLAWALARTDITHRYRGSVLGPLWLTISTAVMLTALGFLYAKLFQLDVRSYLPWLAVSLIIWNMMSQAIGEACTTITSAEAVVRQMPLPYSVHAMRTVFRNAVVAAHNLPLIIVVFLIFGVSPGWGALMAIPGVVLLAVNAFWASLLLGMLCARFRDIPPIVASIVQIAFFMTPVIWKPELIESGQVWLPLNPFFAVMETMRGPIMGTGVSLTVWLAAIFYTAIVWVVAQRFFTRFRNRVAFWV